MQKSYQDVIAKKKGMPRLAGGALDLKPVPEQDDELANANAAGPEVQSDFDRAPVLKRRGSDDAGLDDFVNF